LAMLFWQVNVGIVAVGLFLRLLGRTGGMLVGVPPELNLLRRAIARATCLPVVAPPATGSFTPAAAVAPDRTASPPRHRRGEDPSPLAEWHSAQPDQAVGRHVSSVHLARTVGVRPHVRQASAFVANVGSALLWSAVIVMAFPLLIGVLYWGGEQVFGPDWVRFLDGMLGE
jgi:hypothetical protein